MERYLRSELAVEQGSALSEFEECGAVIRGGSGRGRVSSVKAPTELLRDEGECRRITLAVSEELNRLFPAEIHRSIAPVTVICLGNAAFTADSLGPLTGRSIAATRAFIRSGWAGKLPLREVSVLFSGVGGQTGIEAAELLSACIPILKPRLIIAVDALRAVRRSSLCSVIQISEGGVIPGSGVRNAREELSEKTLGVPIVTVGSPTAISSGSIICEALKKAGISELTPSLTEILKDERSFTVTASGADEAIALHARVIAQAINYSLLGAFDI